jgi:hypothetical protein
MRPTSMSFVVRLTILILAICSGPSRIALAGDDHEFELHGQIESMPASGLVGDWTVGGRTVHVSASTRVDQEHGAAVVGAMVEVKGSERADGSVDAAEIEVMSSPGSGGTENEIHGMIEQLPASGFVGDWVVSGRAVRVTSSTVIEQEHGAVAVGATVEVHGISQTDGSLEATRIEVNPSGGGHPGEGEMHFFGTVESLPESGGPGVWIVSGRMVRVTAATTIEREHGAVPGVGSSVEVEGQQLSDGSVEARMVEVKTGGAPGGGQAGGYIELKGRVESLPSGGLIGDWTVRGRTVRVDTTTAIEQGHGAVRVGAFVEVHGNQRADGSIDAGRIETKAAGSGGKKAFSFYGMVDRMPASGFVGVWGIGAWTVTVTPSTAIDQEHGSAAVGAYIEVKAKTRSDGTLVATRIEVKSGPGTVGSGGYVTFKGTVESMPTGGLVGDWVVSGRTVYATTGTRFKQTQGPLRIGAFVEVEGNQRTDGSLDAKSIATEQ